MRYIAAALAQSAPISQKNTHASHEEHVEEPESSRFRRWVRPKSQRL